MLHRLVESDQYLSLAHSQRLTDAGIRPSVGAVGSSYDNALAETIKCRCRHLRAYADVWIMPTVTTSALVGTGWVGGLSA